MGAQAQILIFLREQSAQRAAKKTIPNLDSGWYTNPMESNEFTSGARQMNPGFTESRGWQ